MFLDHLLPLETVHLDDLFHSQNVIRAAAAPATSTARASSATTTAIGFCE